MFNKKFSSLIVYKHHNALDNNNETHSMSFLANETHKTFICTAHKV